MGPPHSFIRRLSVLTALSLLCAPFVNGAITNTTFDDTSSAFTFTGSWTPTSASNPCAGCSSKPDPSQTFNETWHDGNCQTTTGGSFTFTGSAVYIFGIDQTETQPDIAFTLGDVQSVHHYTGTERFVYNALFFSATELAGDQTHTVNWILNIDPTTDIAVQVQAALFDYAVVTSGTDVVVTSQDNARATSAALKVATSASLSQAPSSSSPSSTIGLTSASSSLSSILVPASQSDAPSPTATVTVAGAVITLAPQSTTSETHHSNVGLIVGLVLGALVCAALGLVLFFLCRRRKQRQRARADEERQAGGLPPAPPRMRRIRNYTLQPFVDDRPPDMPARSVMAGNVLATGPFAHASPEGRPAVSALDTSVFVAGSTCSPSTACTSSATVDVSAAPSADVPPPAFLDTHMQEAGYTNAHRVSRQLSRSTQSHDEKGAEHEADTDRGATTTFSDTETSARERYLERRLATLEAHVAGDLPPPYEHPEP